MSTDVFLKKFTKFFPVPKSLFFDFVGIDLSKNTVRVMQLQDSKFGKIPKKYREYKLAQKCGLFEINPKYTECEELLDVLKNIKKDFKVNYANISIPEVRNYIYKIKVPSSVGKSLKNVIRYSIDDNVPISHTESLFDFFVINVNEDEIEVVVTVVKKEIIEKYNQIFESVGLKPISFEPETHAVTRGIISPKDKDQYLLINLDKSVSSLAVIKDGIVQYAQTLELENIDFTTSFNEVEAKTLKENINKVLIYWATSGSNTHNEEIGHVYLVGENCYSIELLNYLEKSMALNVKFANVWANTFDLDEYIPEIHFKDSLKYATAIGLALKKLH
jgi:Tfp pilus assembly PilM family ATPase